MNWFKSLLKFCQKVKGKPHYNEIGHDDYTGSYEDGTSNLMWLYADGTIYVEPETGDKPTHYDAFGLLWNQLDRLYSGRFEPSTGRLSLVKPQAGVASHRDVPMALIGKLYEKFNIKEIFTY
jgi:hypothetical protein